jgi:thioredoxin-dependent peroxiredoxin
MLAPLLSIALSATPQVGDVAPDFTVKDIDGNELSLSKLTDSGETVVIAFFLKAFTGG